MHRQWINHYLESAVWSARASIGWKCGRWSPGSSLIYLRSPRAPRSPDAIANAGLDQAGVVSALGFVFTEGLVCAVEETGT